jgi:hypothetical protein
MTRTVPSPATIPAQEASPASSCKFIYKRSVSSIDETVKILGTSSWRFPFPAERAARYIHSLINQNLLFGKNDPSHWKWTK